MNPDFPASPEHYLEHVRIDAEALVNISTALYDSVLAIMWDEVDEVPRPGDPSETRKLLIELIQQAARGIIDLADYTDRVAMLKENHE